MKKLIIFITIISGAMLFSSCLMQKRSMPVSPIQTQVNLTMDNLVYLGEITGTATQSYVLGIPYGGRKYYSANLMSSSTIRIPNNPLNRGYNNALYDALLTKPDADFVLPVSVVVETKQMFLGRMETVTVRGKAFKIK